MKPYAGPLWSLFGQINSTRTSWLESLRAPLDSRRYIAQCFSHEKLTTVACKQFLGNSSGMYWRNVVTGLKLLGANEHLTALSITLNIFPGGEPSLEQSERKGVLNRMNASQQAALRSAQDSVYSAGGFEQLLLPRWKRYIDAHPDEFFL